jgi:hypothetical protein
VTAHLLQLDVELLGDMLGKVFFVDHVQTLGLTGYVSTGNGLAINRNDR